MGAPRKQDRREGHRYRAWELKRQGWKLQDIARALGVSESAGSQWLKRGREQGVAALASHLGSGPPPKLTNEQLEPFRAMVAHGAPTHGDREQIWSSRRVADLIKRTFGVRYHRAHCSWLLRNLGQSVRKPVVRASQRDEAASAQWQEEQWPALKKGRGGRTHHRFLDEAGFYLLPVAVRNYAPVGKTTILRVPLTLDHLSVIGTITPQGRLFFQMQTRSYTGTGVVRFLRWAEECLRHRREVILACFWHAGSPL